MLARLRSRAREEKGFTLIELLVVVLIIGILAAIAIPAFLGQRTGAQDANARSLLRNGAITEESFYADQQKYAVIAADLTTMGANEPNLTFQTTAAIAKSNQIQVLDSAPTGGYFLTTKSASGTDYGYYKSSTGTVIRCKAATPAACTTQTW